MSRINIRGRFADNYKLSAVTHITFYNAKIGTRLSALQMYALPYLPCTYISLVLFPIKRILFTLRVLLLESWSLSFSEKFASPSRKPVPVYRTQIVFIIALSEYGPRLVVSGTDGGNLPYKGTSIGTPTPPPGSLFDSLESHETQHIDAGIVMTRLTILSHQKPMVEARATAVKTPKKRAAMVSSYSE